MRLSGGMRHCAGMRFPAGMRLSGGMRNSAETGVPAGMRLSGGMRSSAETGVPAGMRLSGGMRSSADTGVPAGMRLSGVLRNPGKMRLKVLIPVFLVFIATSLNGQWKEVNLDDGDMAANLEEALAFTKYPTYPQYLEMMQYFAESYPEICRLDTFGTSVEGRLLLAVKISDNVEQNEAEASFLYTSTMHGNELVGYSLMLRLISHLLEGYGEDAEVDRLVDGLEIWINPLANPDGTYYPDNDLSVAESIRYNSDSVDLNREFPDPVKGEAVNNIVGKARETRAMMAFLQEHCFTMSANLHSGAEVVNYPWDHNYSLHADDAWFRFISREYADEAKAVDPDYMSLFTDGISNGAQWYTISGGRQDYVTYYLGGREVTLELSTDMWLPCSRLDEYWQKNERSLINYMSQCLYGIRGRVSDAETGLPLRALVRIPDHDFYQSSVYSSEDHGDFYRLIEEGSYDLIISSSGYNPDTIKKVSVSNYMPAQVDVTLQPYPASLESDQTFSFHIWPNPTAGKLFIRPDITPGELLQITVFSTEGTALLKKDIYCSGEVFSLSLESINSGFYLLRITSGKNTLVKPLLKQ